MDTKRLVSCIAALTLLAGCAGQTVNTRASLDHYRLAEKAYRAGDLQAARQQYEAVLKADPNHVESRFRLGNICLREHDLSGAERQYQIVLRLQPRHAKAHYNLALIHLMQAEEQFKYYTATAPAEQRDDKLMRLLAAIERFSERTSAAGNPLAALADALAEGQAK